MIKTGKRIMQNMNDIRHTLVTVEQYFRDQIAKSRMQTLVAFWSSDYTNHDISCDSYTHTHMYMNYGSYMRPSSSDKHSNNNNNSDRSHKGIDTQQDNVDANYSNLMQVEDNDNDR